MKVVPIKKPMKTKVTVDTVEITPESVKGWAKPPFQREFKMNAKVRALVDELKVNDGVLPGVITLAKLGPKTYLLDGQHRVAAFVESAIPVGYCDVRLAEFESLAEMGQEYVQLNRQLVTLKPDDMLRGLEASLPQLRRIKRDCPVVGYDQVRRNPSSPLLSMSMLLRTWQMGSKEVPSGGQMPSIDLAMELTDDSAEQVVRFATICHEAWGRDPEYVRLWSALNLTICCWLYQHVVAARYSVRAQQLTTVQFKSCLQALSASEKYLEWLRGRVLNEANRGPAYRRIGQLFVARYRELTEKKLLMPAPAWALGRTS